MAKDIDKDKFPEETRLKLGIFAECFRVWFDILRKIDAKIRFLSIEPFIGDVDSLDLKNIHWVIVGGKSGVHTRKMQPEWAENVYRQCKEQNVAFYFKQWGTWGEDGVKHNKKLNGSKLFGKEWKEEPLLYLFNQLKLAV